jgi:hypothetical protein
MELQNNAKQYNSAGAFFVPTKGAAVVYGDRNE